eukprot:6183851-Pleurochrysis_carterae.AAC.1
MASRAEAEAVETAAVLEQVHTIAVENEQLRAQNEELLKTQLALLQQNNELKLELKERMLQRLLARIRAAFYRNQGALTHGEG